VVRGTPAGERGGGGSDSIGPFNTSPFYNVSEMGTRISQMGPINFQWDPNFPKGTHISQMGPYLAQRVPCLPEGYSGSFRCDLKGDGGRCEYDGEKRPPYWWNSVCRRRVSRLVRLNLSRAMG
jgi:hypothetical protein